MNEQQIRQLVINSTLTIEQVRYILDYIVEKTSSFIDINNSYDKISVESSKLLLNLCKKFTIQYIPFNTGGLGMEGLNHHFGTVGFLTEYGPMYFIIDLTYAQFTGKVYPINLKKEKGCKFVPSPGMYISDDVKKQLIESKYITLTERNFDEYISSFIESYRMAKDFDERKFYDNAYELLIRHNVNLIDKDYFNGSSITY